MIAIRYISPKSDIQPVIDGGIDAAASADVVMDAHAWAAISAGNLAACLMLPEAVHHVIIATDPDEPDKQTARRWIREGRRVEISRPSGGGDFNHVLIREAAHE